MRPLARDDAVLAMFACYAIMYLFRDRSGERIVAGQFVPCDAPDAPCHPYGMLDPLPGVTHPYATTITTTTPMPTTTTPLSTPMPTPTPAPVHPSLWVGVRFNGRLGNQMFQAASCYGIARARGARCCLLDFEGSMLQAGVRMLEPPEACPPDANFKAQTEGPHNEQFVASLMDAPVPPANTTVGDYLQSWRYFHGLRPFELREREWGEAWVRAHGVRIGIHVRRGDMGESFRADYFEAAIARLRDLVDAPMMQPSAFVVAAEDMAWVRAQPVFAGMVLSEGHTPYQVRALSMLSLCMRLTWGGSRTWRSSRRASTSSSAWAPLAGGRRFCASLPWPEARCSTTARGGRRPTRRATSPRTTTRPSGLPTGMGRATGAVRVAARRASSTDAESY